MEEGTPHTSADIAAELRITAGTLTASVTQLEKKGYLIRQRDLSDKRIVRITATEKGAAANERHMDFHRRMVSGVLSELSPPEAEILKKALSGIDRFFKDAYAQLEASEHKTDRMETET